MANSPRPASTLRSRGADGRAPRRAQPRLILFFCPIRASSADQISGGFVKAKVSGHKILRLIRTVQPLEARGPAAGRETSRAQTTAANAGFQSIS